MRHGLRWRAFACALLVGIVVSGCTTSSADDPTSTPASSGPSASVAVTPSVADTSSVATSPSASVTVASTPETSTLASLSPEAQETADRAAVEAAWDRFWDAALSVVRTPDAKRNKLMSSVAVDPILSEILVEARDSESKGLDRYGAMTAHPYWNQSIEGATTAVMEDCQDSSQSGMLDTTTNEKKTVGVAKNNTRGSFIKGSDGIWRVSNVFYFVDIPC